MEPTLSQTDLRRLEKLAKAAGRTRTHADVMAAANAAIARHASAKQAA